MNNQDLRIRLFNFARDTILFLKTVPYSAESKEYRGQIVRSCTSAGANYAEAQGGGTRLEFKNRIRISVREMRETHYWLQILSTTEPKADQAHINSLINESEQLCKILGTILKKMKS